MDVSESVDCDDPQDGDDLPVNGRNDPETLKKKRRKHTQEVGSRILQTREARGMKQVELAEAAEVKPHTMWRYEDGQMMPGPDKLHKIADALGVPASWLLRGGSTPPGLSFDKEPPKRVAADPTLVLEQQLQLLDEVDAQSDVRSAWTIHMNARGKHQKITRVYLSRFIEKAEQELAAGASIEEAEKEAGTWALNALKEARVASRSRRRKPK